VNVSRTLLGALLAIASLGAIIRSANGGSLARVSGVFAAMAMGAVAVGVLRRRPWAYGSAFLLGLFWLWAVVALRIQGQMDTREFVVWLAWSIVVTTMSVRARGSDDERSEDGSAQDGG
jgi:hypothetical protein